eukprot:TRINITY_DN10889_c0_g1_i3.p2 TRINITY_DN10889_c0_g1~~TRINITY_DN10889_c0_g1_i3.p2  ORF type:complete len:216 (-),score=15.38 TRINITY_DN10889_c0_g1_i3:42-689(-)
MPIPRPPCAIKTCRAFMAATLPMAPGTIPPKVGIAPMAAMLAGVAPPPFPADSGLGAPHRRQLSLRAKLNSLQLGQLQSPGIPDSKTTLRGLGAPQLRQVSLRANWWSPQLSHVQSPGSIPFPAPFPELPAPPGRAAPHLRQEEFLAKLWSPHDGHSQSPGSKSFGGSEPMALFDAAGSGLGVPHLRHVSFLAKLWSLQFGHNQSPGLAKSGSSL